MRLIFALNVNDWEIECIALPPIGEKLQTSFCTNTEMRP